LITVLLGRLQPAESQTSTPESLLQEAISLTTDSFYDEAIEKLDAVSRQYPGTDFDVEARLQKAYILGAALQEDADARAIYQSLVRDFPGRPGAFIAEENLADFELIVDHQAFPDYLGTLDDIIRRAGGPSLSQVIAGHVAGLEPVATLSSQEQRAILAELYSLASSRMTARPASEASPELLERALCIKLFLQTTFPRETTSGLSEAIRDLVLEKNGLLKQKSSFGVDSSPPRIVEVIPGDRTSTGTQPFIKIVLNDGDIRESQIDLSSLELTVDGVDMRGLMQVDSHVDTHNVLGNNRVFQRLTIRVEPQVQPALCAGPHHLLVAVSDVAGNRNQETAMFTVRPGGNR
jgi:hypothetical protein